MFYQHQHFGVSEYFCKELGENFSYPLHLHHSFELITVLEGEMTVQVADATYRLTTGEAVVVFPEQLHALSSTKSRHLLIIFSADIIGAYASKHASSVPKSCRIKLPHYLADLLSELDRGASAVKMKAVLYSVCALLDESTEYVKRKAVEDNLLYAIFDFAEKNAVSDCSLESLSQSTGYNQSYLSRYFSESTGMSFVSLVNRIRIGKACYLLKSTTRPVIECAYDCGYKSLRSFNRNFKLYVGMTPKAYRKDDGGDP